jgi:tetratricopeptide (TPR) repeat protein
LARNTFVGREHELAELDSACESGADSDAHLFLIYGEPGIGKTRLADELASHAKARGMQVLWGRCWEGDGAPAYWPWIQIIRTFLGALGLERRTLTVESETAADMIREVAQIVPDLRRAQSSLPSPGSDRQDPNEARFRLFDAVTNFLKIGARSRPMLIVLDDLHDADEASLAMLRFMARELRSAPILIVATFRDLEVRRSPSLGKLVGELSREAHTIPLGSLSQSEVRRFVEVMVGRAPDDSLVAKLCAATNGNPLFVDGIVRNLIAEGGIGSDGSPDREFKIPSGVREAIRAHLATLSPEANSILTVAAAIGNEFAFNLCRSAANVSGDEAHRLLDEASDAGIVRPLGGGRYRFCHALIRSAVYEELDTAGRVQVHRKIAEQMEETYQADIDSHLAELANHFREANVPDKAIGYFVRAGYATASVFAFSDAAIHWQAALDRMEASDSNAGFRAELLGSLGDVTHSINQEKSVVYRESAIALYESIGCFDEAARIRIRLGRSFSVSGQPITNSALASEQFRHAEIALSKGPETIELAWLYEGIAACEQQRLDLTRCGAAARRAMEIAERINSKLVWSAAAAFQGFVLAIGGELKEGFALFDQAFEAADQANFPGSGHALANLAGWCCEWLGDLRAARAWFERELNRPRNARSLWARRELSNAVTNTFYHEGQTRELLLRAGPGDPAVRFWIAGEWEAIAALVESWIVASERADDRLARLNHSLTLGSIYIVLGNYARAVIYLGYGLGGDLGPLSMHEMRVRPYLAQCYVAMNRLDAAVAEVARCRQIMSAGEDWRGRVGDVALAEGVVAAARGDFNFADRQFEDAVSVHRKFHGAWQESNTLNCWGRALAAAGDTARAAEKFDAAIEVSRARGVGPRFIDWIAADKARALGSAPARTDFGAGQHLESAKASTTGTFRREGEFWTISYRSDTFRLKDAKGLHYVAYLLAHPGQRLHVRDLIEAVEGSAVGRRTTIDAESEGLEIVSNIGGAAATIDARARAEYRTRLRDLQVELDEAERMNDLGRVERLSTEIEMVGQELAASTGLGGRVRKASGSAERARGLVGKNIRAALEKIRGAHPTLGRYLAATTSIGYFCSYQPEPDHPISWQF